MLTSQHNHGVFIKAEINIGIDFPEWYTFQQFPGVFLNSLVCDRFGLFLSFKTQTLLRHTCQVFCRISIILGLSDAFSWLHWGYACLGRTPQR